MNYQPYQNLLVKWVHGLLSDGKWKRKMKWLHQCSVKLNFFKVMTNYHDYTISVFGFRCKLSWAKFGRGARFHDDVITWKHFPRHWSPVDSPHKGQWRGALMFSLICAWANHRDAGDLRPHPAHYDVTVMLLMLPGWYNGYVTSRPLLGMVPSHEVKSL